LAGTSFRASTIYELLDKLEDRVRKAELEQVRLAAEVANLRRHD